MSVFTYDESGTILTGVVSLDLSGIVVASDISSTVTTIGEGAFLNQTGLVSITLPASVTTISTNAFAGCSALTTIDLSNITSLGVNAFALTGLTSVAAPSLSYLGGGAFSVCSALTSASLGGSFAEIPNSLFYNTPLVSIDLSGCTALSSIPDNYFYQFSSLSNVVLSPSINTLGSQCFAGCTQLSSINIGNVTTIGVAALSGCSALTSIDLGSATSIGVNAFSGTGVTSVSTRASLTSLGDYAFAGCGSLTSASLNGSFPTFPVTPFVGTALAVLDLSGCTGISAIPNNAFMNYTTLTTVVLPTCVKTLSSECFRNCVNLSSINLGSVATIDVLAFYNCPSLTSVNLESAVTIGESAFFVTGITSVSTGASLTTLGNNVFAACGSLTSAFLRGSFSQYPSTLFNGAPLVTLDLSGCTAITELPAQMCMGYSSLVSAVLPPGVSTISVECFRDCVKLASVNLNGITTVSNLAFYNCPSLSNVDLATMVGIGENAFAVTGITSVNTSASLAALGDAAFAGCGALSSVVLRGSFSPYPASLFTGAPLVTLDLSGCTAITELPIQGFIGNTFIASVVLPPGVSTIGYECFRNCSQLSSINLGNVTAVSDLAFYGCYSLNNVNLESAVTIGPNAFAGTSITSVSTGASLAAIGDAAFAGCAALTTAVLRGSFKVYPAILFAGAPVVSLDLSGCTAITGLPAQACFGYSSLVSVVLPPGVFAIDAECFAGCTSLCNINLDAVTNIGNSAFVSSGLTTVVTSPMLNSLGVLAFAECPSLVSVTLNGVLTEIPDSAFYNCPNLSSVTFPDTVNTLRSNAFAVCPSLRFPNDTLPEGIQSIYPSAFAAYGGSTIRMPASLRVLDYNAIVASPNLSAIYFLGPRPNLVVPEYAVGNGVVTYYYASNKRAVDVGYGTWTDLAGSYDPTPDDPYDPNWSVVPFTVTSARYVAYKTDTQVFAQFTGQQSDSTFILYDGAGAALGPASSNMYFAGPNFHEVVFNITNAPARVAINGNADVPALDGMDVIAINSSDISDTHITVRFKLPSSVPSSSNPTLIISDLNGNLRTMGTGVGLLMGDGSRVMVLNPVAGSSMVPGQYYSVSLALNNRIYKSKAIVCSNENAPPVVSSALSVGKIAILTVAGEGGDAYAYLDVSAGAVVSVAPDTDGFYMVPVGASFVGVGAAGEVSDKAEYTATEIVGAPQGVTVDASGNLVWEAVENAEGYRVYVSTLDGRTPVAGESAARVKILDVSADTLSMAGSNFRPIYTYNYTVTATYKGLDSTHSSAHEYAPSLASAAEGSVPLDDYVANQLSTGDATALLSALTTFASVFDATAAVVPAVDATVLLTAADPVATSLLSNCTLVVPLFDADGSVTIPPPEPNSVLYVSGAPGETRTINVTGTTTPIVVTFPDADAGAPANAIQIPNPAGEGVLVLVPGDNFQAGYDVLQYAGHGSAGLVVIPRTAIASVLINGKSFDVKKTAVDVPAGTVTFDATAVNSYADVSGLAASYTVPLGLSVPVEFVVTFDNQAGDVSSEVVRYTLTGIGVGSAAAAPTVTSLTKRSVGGYLMTLPVTGAQTGGVTAGDLLPAEAGLVDTSGTRGIRGGVSSATSYTYYNLYDANSTTVLATGSTSLATSSSVCVVFDVATLSGSVCVRGYDLSGTMVTNYTQPSASFSVDGFAVPVPISADLSGSTMTLDMDITDISSVVIYDTSGVFWGSSGVYGKPVKVKNSVRSIINVGDTFILGAVSAVTGAFATTVGPTVTSVSPPPNTKNSITSIAYNADTNEFTMIAHDLSNGPFQLYDVSAGAPFGNTFGATDGVPLSDAAGNIIIIVGPKPNELFSRGSVEIRDSAGTAIGSAVPGIFSALGTKPATIKTVDLSGSDLVFTLNDLDATLTAVCAVAYPDAGGNLVATAGLSLTESQLLWTGSYSNIGSLPSMLYVVPYYVDVNGGIASVTPVRGWTGGSSSSVPATPTNVVVASSTDTTVSVTWDAVADATDYKCVLWADDQNVTVVDSKSGPSASATFSSLTANTTYWVSVVAISSAGQSAPSSVVIVKTLPSAPVAPATPTNVAVTSTDTTVSVTWDAVADATEYKCVLWADDQSVTAVDNKVGSSASATFSSLTANTTYWVSVVAISSAGQSAPSSVVIVKTLPSGPPPPPSGVVCFLGNAPVLTPSGYRRIDSLREGDLVQTADGRAVAIQQVAHQRVAANAMTNPYVIERGQFGAERRLMISPEHRVAISGRGMIEARHLGLAQEERTGTLDYYNLELPNWKGDNLVVAGVEVESLAPVRRVVISHAMFRQMLVQQYGPAMTPALQAKILSTCKFLPGGRVEVPTMRR